MPAFESTIFAAVKSTHAITYFTANEPTIFITFKKTILTTIRNALVPANNSAIKSAH
jgi:hypothetical protein